MSADLHMCAMVHTCPHIHIIHVHTCYFSVFHYLTVTADWENSTFVFVRLQPSWTKWYGRDDLPDGYEVTGHFAQNVIASSCHLFLILGDWYVCVRMPICTWLVHTLESAGLVYVCLCVWRGGMLEYAMQVPALYTEGSEDKVFLYHSVFLPWDRISRWMKNFPFWRGGWLAGFQNPSICPTILGWQDA